MCGKDCTAFLEHENDLHLVLTGIGLSWDQRRVIVFRDTLVRSAAGVKKGPWVVGTAHHVCTSAYARLMGISASTLKAWKGQALERFAASRPRSIAPLPHGRTGLGALSWKTQECARWCLLRLQKYGEFHPSLHVISVDLWVGIQDLFFEYAETMRAHQVATVSYRTFSDLFDNGSCLRDALGARVVFGRGCTQKKCSPCTALRRLRARLFRKGCGDGSIEMEEWDQRHKAHIGVAMSLRRFYGQKCEEARRAGPEAQEQVFILDESHAPKTPAKAIDTQASRGLEQLERLTESASWSRGSQRVRQTCLHVGLWRKMLELLHS